MSKFDAYFLMDAEDVVSYVKEKMDTFQPDAQLKCEEIGDGNLNYVFRVTDSEAGKSLIVKQAGNTARISEDIHLSTNRIRIEAEALRLEGELAPGLVPEVYLFDGTMSCFVMEDLSSYTIMRSALMDYEMFPDFADHITTFMAETLVRTSDVVMCHKEKKELQQRFINPELCEITEDLVYTEPYYNQNGRNSYTAGNEEYFADLLMNDEALKLEVAKLKFDFMSKGQSLLHGDLHTGSVFITKEKTKVIDPEFAFYGPMGYDIGNVVANLIFAWARGTVNEQREFTQWAEEAIKDTIDLFKLKFIRVWEENVTEITAKQESFRDAYLLEVLSDTAAVTGLELNRRVVGLAKVKDLTSIVPEERKIQAERICVESAVKFIKNRNDIRTGEDFIQVLKTSLSMTREEV